MYLIHSRIVVSLQFFAFKGICYLPFNAYFGIVTNLITATKILKYFGNHAKPV